jgi:hypothetical protein
MTREISFTALDGERLTFKIPAKCNAFLVQKACEKAHKGLEPDMVDFGLTRTETEFVAEIVAKLEEHIPAKAEVGR